MAIRADLAAQFRAIVAKWDRIFRADRQACKG
jgi:hypothetical protein